MLETTRRRFLFSLGASGALIATPIQLTKIAEIATAPAAAPEASGLLGRAVLRIVGEIRCGRPTTEGAVEITAEQLRSFKSPVVSAIELDSLGSACREFIPGPMDPGAIEIEGVIDRSLQDAVMDGRVFPVAFALPGGKEWISTRAYVSEISFRA